jgi:hypothetical protein
VLIVALLHYVIAIIINYNALNKFAFGSSRGGITSRPNFGILHKMLPAQRPSSPTFYLALTPALPLLFPAPGRPRRRSGVEESAPSSAWRSYERFVHFRKFVRASAAINLYTALANFHDLRNFKFSFKIAYRRPLTPPPPLPSPPPECVGNEAACDLFPSAP